MSVCQQSGHSQNRYPVALPRRGGWAHPQALFSEPPRLQPICIYIYIYIFIYIYLYCRFPRSPPKDLSVYKGYIAGVVYIRFCSFHYPYYNQYVKLPHAANTATTIYGLAFEAKCMSLRHMKSPQLACEMLIINEVVRISCEP